MNGVEKGNGDNGVCISEYNVRVTYVYSIATLMLLIF